MAEAPLVSCFLKRRLDFDEEISNKVRQSIPGSTRRDAWGRDPLVLWLLFFCVCWPCLWFWGSVPSSAFCCCFLCFGPLSGAGLVSFLFHETRRRPKNRSLAGIRSVFVGYNYVPYRGTRGAWVLMRGMLHLWSPARLFPLCWRALFMFPGHVRKRVDVLL